MLEMIALGAAGVAGVFGHVKTKDYIQRKLRYTPVAEKPAVPMGVAAGAVSTVGLAALPLITFLPAVVVGAGIGTGVAAGIRRARRRQ